MLKLLIVDDEPNILAGLVRTFPWEKWGFTVVGSALNGRVALELIKEHRPDAVITDIRMKHMTGLELIEQSLALYPAITFIVISAYRDFDYAKEACRLGAFTYLLKPLTETLLRETMHSVREFCLQQQEYSRLTQTYNTFLNKHSDGYICALLRSYMQEEIREEEFTEALAFVGSDWHTRHYICVCAAVEPGVTAYPSRSGPYILLQYLQKHLTRYFNGYVCEGPDSRLLILLTIPAGSIMNRNRLTEMFDGFRQAFQMDIVYSTSKEYDQVEDIKKAAKEAAALITMADQAGLDQLYPESLTEQDLLPGAPFQYPQDHTMLILNAIRAMNTTGARKAMEGFILKLAPISDTEYQKLCIQRLALEILSSFIEPGFPEPLRSSFQNFIGDFTLIPVLKTIPILNGHINQLILYLEERSCLNTSDTTITYVEQAKLYAARHLADEHLNVTTVAEALHLNPVYFGRIFKKGTGTGFKAYLLKLRLDEASRLLTETSLSIVKITEQTGFPNPSYFSQLFKTNIGCLPNEYRKGILP